MSFWKPSEIDDNRLDFMEIALSNLSINNLLNFVVMSIKKK